MDNNNLTPEELEQLQREQEQAQMQTGPNLYDRINQVRSDYSSIRNKIESSKLKNKSFNSVGDESSLAGDGGGLTGGKSKKKGNNKNVSDKANSAHKAGKAAEGATKKAGKEIGKKSAANAASKGAKAAVSKGSFLTKLSKIPGLGKAMLIIGGIVLGVLLLGGILAALWYSVIDPLSVKYSVEPEKIVNEYDDDISSVTNTDYEELNELFKDEISSKLSIWDEIRLFLFDHFGLDVGGDYSDAVTAKIIQLYHDDKMKEMSTTNEEDLPLGALINTFTYTYASQFLDSENTSYTDKIEYIDPETGEIVLGDVTTDRVNPTTPISMVSALLNMKILTLGKDGNPDDIGDLLDHMVFHEFYPTYSWGEMDRDCEYDDVTGN